MTTFLVNYNIFGNIEIEAKNKEDAENKFLQKGKQEILNILSEEIDTGSLEVGTIEKL